MCPQACKCCGRAAAPSTRAKRNLKNIFCDGCRIAWCPESLADHGKPSGSCPGQIRALCSCCGLREVERIRHIALRALGSEQRPMHVAQKVRKCPACQILQCTKTRRSLSCPLRVNEKFAPRRLAVV